MNAVRRVLCRLDDIPDGQAKGFTLEVVGDPFGEDVFVVRRGGAVFGYVNSCPHTGVPLDSLPDKFIDRGGELILCSLHGALFRPEDGHCVEGPCAGKRLARFEIEIRDGAVVVA